jgi:hypothetical protein
MSRTAIVAGTAAATATGGTMAAATVTLSGPVANLGGYAVAQIAAGSIGLGGPALSAGIAALGGPVVVAGALTVGVGYGVYRLVRWLSS